MYRTSILGDDFFLFSQENFFGPSCTLFGDAMTVGLLPSITADFSLIGYTKLGKPLSDYRAAAISAAAFLVLKRGLPLSEILFETPGGNIEVFYTGGRIFEVSTPKCKQIITNKIEVMGCVVEYADFCTDALFRVIRTDNIDNFDLKIIPRFASVGEKTPSSVILYSVKDSKIDMRTYSEFNPSPPSAITCFGIASYAAFFKTCASQFAFGGAICRLDYGGARISLKPEIYEEEFT